MSNRLTSLDRSIAGRVAIITGAGSGMGRATAHLFTDEGARVAICDLDAEALDRVRDEIADVHGDGSVLAQPCDVADADQLASLVAATVEAFDGVDIVVNNAGMVTPTPLAGATDDDFMSGWARTVDVNLSAAALLVRAALPHLLESDAARIVNIASTEAIVATAGLSAYSATKAGVTGLTRSMAVELGRLGITANCICPGPIDTGMTAEIDPDAKATYARRRVPMRRYGDPEEVAQMTLNLCLPASSYVNGAVVPVDGGMVVRHT